MIDPKNLMFHDWSVQRRIESLRLMEKEIKLHGDRLAHDTTWQEYGGGMCVTKEETEAKWKSIAEDDEKYINALFAFYICQTTDTSWC